MEEPSEKPAELEKREEEKRVTRRKVIGHYYID